MSFATVKSLFPNKPVSLRILRGPFRGARIMMNPRDSLRKVFGIYEHELNPWLEAALRRVNRVLDVGANDGYFTFGCAAAFQRLGRHGEIIAFEPQQVQVQLLHQSLALQERGDVRVNVIQAFVGREVRNGVTTLDELHLPKHIPTLVKIDVEGAEAEVVFGGQSLIRPENVFVIEIHREDLSDILRQKFAEVGHQLVAINQRPFPLLGREVRETTNSWLVSELHPAN